MNMRVNLNTRHLAMMINDRCYKYGDRTALHRREAEGWKGITWNDMGGMINAVSLALLEFDVKDRECVGIYSANRPEWAIADYGILNIGAVTVPIYATDTSSQAEYIINDAEIRVIFVDGAYQLESVMKFFRMNRYLEKIIVFDGNALINGNDDVVDFEKFLAIGRNSDREDRLAARRERMRSEDIATIIYTSGTTGDPKGVILTHANIFSQFTALDKRFSIGEKDVELCFLPLSHAYARISGYWMQKNGAAVYYCEDPGKIMEYFREVRPTYMVGVPRLYEKMYAAVQDSLERSTAFKRALFRWSVNTGRDYQYRRLRDQSISLLLRLKHFVAHRAVLRKIRNLLGGRLNFFSAGGAPLAREIEEFFFAADVFIAQGYGLTETSPMITCNHPGRFKFGTAGSVIVNSQIRIDDDGEILVRGANVTRGYYKKPAENREVFTEDGWFRTGDVGHVDEEGFLHITERKKDLIITAQGKNIAPQGIESLIGCDHYVEQIAIIGDRRRFLTALVVPSFGALREWARRGNIEYSTDGEMVKDPRVIDFYARRIEKLTASLPHYEKIKKFLLLPNEFTLEKGEITPTMKIRRKVVEEHFGDVIDKMYSS